MPISSSPPPCPESICGTYRAVVTSNILWLVELREDVLRENLAEIHAHLVYTDVSTDTGRRNGGRGIPKELMPQTTPCVKILCS